MNLIQFVCKVTLLPFGGGRGAGGCDLGLASCLEPRGMRKYTAIVYLLETPEQAGIPADLLDITYMEHIILHTGTYFTHIYAHQV